MICTGVESAQTLRAATQIIDLTLGSESIEAGCTFRVAWVDSGSDLSMPPAQTMVQRLAYHDFEKWRQCTN